MGMGMGVGVRVGVGLGVDVGISVDVDLGVRMSVVIQYLAQLRRRDGEVRRSCCPRDLNR